MWFCIVSCTSDGNYYGYSISKETRDTELFRIIEKKYSADTLKLKAALFLMVNMGDKGTKDFLVKDKEYRNVAIELYRPEINRTNIHFYLDSLNYFLVDTVYRDKDIIKPDFFCNNLEQAFNMWQTKPWSNNYSFEIFCEFILPYRIGNESLDENWRTYFQDKYLPVLDTMQANDKVDNVFQFIKTDINRWYRFAFNTIDLKPTMSLDEVLNCGKGNCTDVANVFLYALRAIGVAATIDYIRLWGRTNYGHCELVYWDEKNEPKRLKTGNLLQTPPPKVYRQYYSNQENNLFKNVKDPTDIPPHLKEKYYQDVTNEYTKTSTLNVKPEKQPENGILYLSVFNAGQWQPIAWSDSIVTKTGEFVFEDMGRNIVYLPSAYIKKSNIPNGQPFIISKKGEVRSLELRTDSLISMVFLTKGIENKLLYWDNKWKTVGRSGIMNDSLRFENVPTNTIYRLVKTNGNQMERIFTYTNKKRRNW